MDGTCGDTYDGVQRCTLGRNTAIPPIDAAGPSRPNTVTRDAQSAAIWQVKKAVSHNRRDLWSEETPPRAVAVGEGPLGRTQAMTIMLSADVRPMPYNYAHRLTWGAVSTFSDCLWMRRGLEI